MSPFSRLVLTLALLPSPAFALDLPADAPFVTATLNGAPVRLRVDFAASGLLMLDPAAARRLNLPATAGSTVVVGPVVLPGQSGAGILAIDDRRQPVRLLWNDRPPTDDGPAIDGVVSPGALPVDSVRLVRPVTRPTRRRAFAARFDPAGGVMMRQAIGGRRTEVRLAPATPDTLASAATGAAVTRRHDGRLGTGGGTRRILFGIARPVRPLDLGRPLTVAGRRIDRLLVRTADYAGDTGLPGAAVPVDGDEIVVTARASGRPRFRLNLGADVLGDCAAIGWQARARRIVLDCPD
jgi:hypothetical protein